jgi:hypothetical protein
VFVNVGRGGGVLSGPASFFSRSGYHLFGVLNIAGAAVSPSIIDGTQAVFDRHLRSDYCLNFRNP